MLCSGLKGLLGVLSSDLCLSGSVCVLVFYVTCNDISVLYVMAQMCMFEWMNVISFNNHFFKSTFWKCWNFCMAVIFAFFLWYCLLPENFPSVKIKPVWFYNGNRRSFIKITALWNVLSVFLQIPPPPPPAKITMLTVNSWNFYMNL